MHHLSSRKNSSHSWIWQVFVPPKTNDVVKSCGALKIIRKWLECYLWHIFLCFHSWKGSLQSKISWREEGFEQHQKPASVVVVVGMKAFIRRECRDHPIRDSTQISPTTTTAWKGFYDWLAALLEKVASVSSSSSSFPSFSWMPKEDFPLSFEACLLPLTRALF